MESVECVVIGAGVVGLAIAHSLAIAGREVLILERNDRHGQETSSRNSGVIHAGLYYPGASLKAKLCVRGRQLLYEYCKVRSIPHRRCGKLVVATLPQQRDALLRLQHTAEVNGVSDLQWLDGPRARALEPALKCDAALLSPSTGIVDVHALMQALIADAEDAGATLVLRAEVEAMRGQSGELEILCRGESRAGLRARWVVNAAGLQAGRVCASIAGFPAAHCPRLYWAKGSYFSLSGRAPFEHLIYPLPEPGALGVHLTLDLGGQARFGPDIEWVDEPDYRVDPLRRESFGRRIREFWPGLADERLSPDYAGVRPKLSAPGQPPADFRIEGPEQHGFAGIINLFGIESPGLTAALAIGLWVAGLIDSC